MAQPAFNDSYSDTPFPSQDRGRVLKNMIGNSPCFPLLVPLPCLYRSQNTKERLYTYEEGHIGITLSQIAVWEISQCNFGLLTILLISKADLPWPVFYSHRICIPSHTPHPLYCLEWALFQNKSTFHRDTDHCNRSSQTVSWTGTISISK